MKLLVLSDLHIERSVFDAPRGREFDVVLLAGDIHTPGRRAVPWARKTFGTKTPIVLVPGNHEFYAAERVSELQSMREAAHGTNVHVLDRDELILVDQAGGGEVRFLGCTLWTDFALPFRAQDGGLVVSDAPLAIDMAQRRMYDYEAIEEVGPADGQLRKWRAERSREQHWVDRTWLLNCLNRPFPGRTVVVTHHAPCLRSVPQKYLHDPLTPGFCSDLPDDFFGQASLWVHGHHHTSSGYVHRGTRVICNPRGCLTQDGAFENLQFDPRLVVEI